MAHGGYGLVGRVNRLNENLAGARWEFLAAHWTCLLKTEMPKALDAFAVESMLARESDGVIRTQLLETYGALLEACYAPLLRYRLFHYLH